MKKITALLLVVLMLAQLASCGNGESSKENNVETSDNTVTADTETESESETERKPALPDKDYGGQTLHMVTETGFEKYIYASEQTGEPVNDALYTARTNVEEQFNVSLLNDIVVPEGARDITESTVKSGEDTFFVAQNHDRTTASLALNGWLYNVYDLPYIDTTAEWWPQFTLDSLTINGRMYYISNYTGWNGLAFTRVVFANMGHVTDFGLENPFEMVYNKTWTLDNFAAMTKDIYVDVDGNGARDRTDTYGFFYEKTPYCWLEGFGVELYQKEGENSAQICLAATEPRVVELVEKLHDWCYSGAPGVNVNLDEDWKGTDRRALYAQGNSVFLMDSVGGTVDALTDSDIEYAILPFPLLDDTQKDYIGACTDRLLFVPITVQDLEQTGILIEALNYEGYRHVLPTYQENTLKKRYATSEDTSKMLDIIFANRVISLSYLYGDVSLNFLGKVVPNNTIASYIESVSKKEQTTIDQIIALHSSDETK